MISPQRAQRTQKRHRGALFFSLFFVLSVSSVVNLFAASPTTAPTTRAAFEVVGRIDSPAIPESSGIVRSRRFEGVYWTHNDSGNPPQIFAIDKQGKLLATIAIAAVNVDWEDIALDEQGHLYLADIGNNIGARTQVQVYRVSEPDPNAPPGPRDPVRPDRTWQLRYPDKPFDAESLFILGDSGYVIAKNRDVQPAGVYRFDLSQVDRPQILRKVVELPLRWPVTAADLSPDRRWLAVMTVGGPSIYRIDSDVLKVVNGASWSALFLDPNIEGVCFTPGGLLATTEGRRMIFFRWSPSP